MAQIETALPTATELASRNDPQSLGRRGKGGYITVWMPDGKEPEPPREQAAAGGVPFMRRMSAVEQGSCSEGAVGTEPLPYKCSKPALVHGGASEGHVHCRRCWTADQASSL